MLLFFICWLYLILSLLFSHFHQGSSFWPHGAVILITPAFLRILTIWMLFICVFIAIIVCSFHSQHVVSLSRQWYSAFLFLVARQGLSLLIFKLRDLNKTLTCENKTTL